VVDFTPDPPMKKFKKFKKKRRAPLSRKESDKQSTEDEVSHQDLLAEVERDLWA